MNYGKSQAYTAGERYHQRLNNCMSSFIQDCFSFFVQVCMKSFDQDCMNYGELPGIQQGKISSKTTQFSPFVQDCMNSFCSKLHALIFVQNCMNSFCSKLHELFCFQGCMNSFVPKVAWTLLFPRLHELFCSDCVNSFIKKGMHSFV